MNDVTISFILATPILLGALAFGIAGLITGKTSKTE